MPKIISDPAKRKVNLPVWYIRESQKAAVVKISNQLNRSQSSVVQQAIQEYRDGTEG